MGNENRILKMVSVSKNIYSVEGFKSVPSPQERAKGVRLLSSLGFEVFPNFGGQ